MGLAPLDVPTSSTIFPVVAASFLAWASSSLSVHFIVRAFVSSGSWRDSFLPNFLDFLKKILKKIFEFFDYF